MDIAVEVRGMAEGTIPVVIVQCGSIAELNGKVDYVCAPDPRRVEPFATICRGENQFGSLSEELFVVPGGLACDCRYFLWMADDGSQEDDVPRLRLLGFVEPQDLPDVEGMEVDALAAACLLYGYVRFAITEWDASHFEEAEFTSHLDEPLLDLEDAFRNAEVGLPHLVGEPAPAGRTPG
jgi:hypothetical protein